MEIFKDIKGYEGMYQVSNYGNVKSLSRFIKNGYSGAILKEIILKPTLTDKGYKVVDLRNNGRRRTWRVHRLVTEAFIPNPENKLEVNHIDGIKTNNNVGNLEWNTHIENIRHANKNGLFDYSKSPKGEKHGLSKLKTSQVIDIKIQLRDKTKTQAELAREYNVSHVSIYSIKAGINWAHITI